MQSNSNEDMDQKKRRVVSYENMDEALAAAFAEKYPKGFSDYLPEAIKYDKPDGTFFYAVTVETEDAIALVKVNVKTDAAEDIERWLDSDSDDDDTAADEGEGDEIIDDNISQYSNAEDDPADQE